MPRKTLKTMTVLSIIADSSIDGTCGAEIMRRSKLWSGTTYQILQRILDAGWVTAEWEAGDPVLLQRPLMRLYKITAVGSKELDAWRNELMSDMKSMAGGIVT